MARVVIICGVSGCGKTTVGQQLAEALGLRFVDADDFHPAANRQKMARGEPLNDGDRVPWLIALADAMPDWAKQGGAVLACSALKESYRTALARAYEGAIEWVTLQGSAALLQARLEARGAHFFDPTLLASQLDTFEPPAYGRHFDISRPPEDIVRALTQT